MAEPQSTPAPAPAPETVSLTIDGRAVTVPKGTTLIQAAKTAGVDISYFCWHPGLSIAAVCRQCLVEIVGQPKLAPACQVTCADKMQVLTGTDRVLAVRQQLLELTLLNHPVDCPICDKAGECQLQKLYLEWDAKAARIDFPKIHKPKVVDLGPRVVLDAERCILCTRCVRVCNEVAKAPELTVSKRGNHAEIAVAPGHRLENPYSLCTVDVCPVGALTSKDFRFAMRAWELWATASVCPGCATGCNVEIHHQKGRVYRLVPRLNARVNRYWMCDAGRLTYQEIYDARLGTPAMVGALRSWEQALAAAAEALRPALADDPGRVGIVLSAELSNEDAFAAARLAHGLGLMRLYAVGRPAGEQDDILVRADKNPNTAGLRAVTRGKAHDRATLEADLAAGTLSALLCFGDPGLSDAALAAARRLKVVVASAHETPFTKAADVALPATLWAEHDGTYTNAKGLTQRARRAVEPPGQARPAWSIARELGQRLGQKLAWDSARAVFAEMSAAVPDFAGADFGREMATIQLRFKGSRG